MLWNQTLAAYELYGNERYMIQEKITQINHVLQAASIAKLAGAPNAIIVALLFHDIGQVIKEENIGHIEILHSDHAEIGAEWLKQNGFPKSVSDFVFHHALAKVMLCEREPAYFDNLSLASQISYTYQKKKYDQKPQVEHEFSDHPLLDHYLAARKCDDMSKMIHISLSNGNLRGFDHYKELVFEVYSQKEEETWSEEWIDTINRWHSLMVDSPERFEEMMVKMHRFN